MVGQSGFWRWLIGGESCLVAGTLGVWLMCPGIAHARFLHSIAPSLSFPMAQSSPALSGSWRLVSLGEMAAPDVVPQSMELTAEFEGDRLFGSGGCNRFTGGFETQGNQLSVGPLASTFMACEPPISTQETRYFAALQGAQRYEIDEQGQLLVFYETEEETGVLQFSRQPIPGLW